MVAVNVDPRRHSPPAQSGRGVWSRLGAAVIRSVSPKVGEIGSVYGLILVGSLMAAESYKHETHLDVLLSVLLTLVIYWLAHAYSLALGLRIESSRSLSLHSLREGLLSSASVLEGALIPLLALLVAWAAGASSQLAIDLALWSSIATLVALELLAGVRAKERPLELLLSCCVGVGMGAAVLALKALLH